MGYCLGCAEKKRRQVIESPRPRNEVIFLDKPMVSVIMPVYNVDRYLEKAIRSVLAQTFSDFELILIDDGSTDKSAEICDGFLSYTNVAVLHIPNSGVAHARNTGLKTAKGKYIAFLTAMIG